MKIYIPIYIFKTNNCQMPDYSKIGIRPCMGGIFWIWVTCCFIRLVAEWNFILICVYVYEALDHIQSTYTGCKKSNYLLWKAIKCVMRLRICYIFPSRLFVRMYFRERGWCMRWKLVRIHHIQCFTKAL